MIRTALFLLLTAAGPGIAAPAPAPTPPAPAVDTIQPDRPGIADGSTVIGPGRFQVETGLQQEFRSTSHRDEQRLFIPTLLRFGVDNRWEARIETNALTYTRTAEPEAGVHRTFVADWGLGPDWALNPNVGVAVYEDGAGRIFTAGLAAVTLTYGPNNRIQPFADVALQSPEETAGRTALIFDGGGTYLLNPNTQLDLSLGTGLAGRTPPRLFWTAGISRRF